MSADAKQNQALQGKSPDEVDFSTVLEKEREYITTRRTSAALRPRPDIAHTVGLAFSGGGIRSATFNLGVVQALHRYGVFSLVDYLSTVSGGGYLGSSISTLMRKKGSKFPFAHNAAEEGQAEGSYTRFLRNHSNYLAEQGLTDYLRIAALLGRGIFINLSAIVPLLLFVSLVIGAIYGSRIDGNLSIPFTVFLCVTPYMAGVALLYFLASPIVIRVWKVRSQLRIRRTEIPEATDESSVDLRN